MGEATLRREPSNHTVGEEGQAVEAAHRDTSHGAAAAATAAALTHVCSGGHHTTHTHTHSRAARINVGCRATSFHHAAQVSGLKVDAHMQLGMVRFETRVVHCSLQSAMMP